MDILKLKQTSKELRKDIVEIAYKTQRGHILSAFSMVEVLVMLYLSILKVDKEFKEDRDYFILSKGHGCLALYCLLAKLNFFPKEELENFCGVESILGGHPSPRKIKGIEASTGSLGHGPSIGVGLALSLLRDKSDKSVFVLVGDGECNEGSVWEAALSANKNGLSNYWIIVDHNKFQSYDSIEKICPMEPFDEKWRSFGFHTARVDMIKNPISFLEEYERLKELPGPKCIICDGVKGLGSKTLEGNLKYHNVRAMDLNLKNKIIEEINS